MVIMSMLNVGKMIGWWCSDQVGEAPVDIRLDVRKFFVSESAIVDNLHLTEERRLARTVSAWKKASLTYIRAI